MDGWIVFRDQTIIGNSYKYFTQFLARLIENQILPR